MRVIIATSQSDGYTSVEGVWDASKYSSGDVERILTERYREDYGYEPEFGDHCIETHIEEVVL